MAGKTKLSKEIEILICDMYDNGIKLEELSKQFDRCPDAILGIRKRNNRAGKRKTIACRGNKIEVDENYFEIIDTSEKAYWLGFFAADGWIELLRGKYLRLGIKLQARDKEHLEKFLISIGSKHKIIITTVHDKRYDTHKDYATIRIGNQKLCEDLERHGFGRNKSKELKLPNISDDLMPSFLKGFIDGDGWITISKENDIAIGIACPVYNFLVECRKYFSEKCNTNKDISIYKRKNRNCNELIYGGNKQGRCLYEYLNNFDSPSLTRKHDVIREFLKNYDEKVKNRKCNQI